MTNAVMTNAVMTNAVVDPAMDEARDEADPVDEAKAGAGVVPLYVESEEDDWELELALTEDARATWEADEAYAPRLMPEGGVGCCMVEGASLGRAEYRAQAPDGDWPEIYDIKPVRIELHMRRGPERWTGEVKYYGRGAHYESVEVTPRPWGPACFAPVAEVITTLAQGGKVPRQSEVVTIDSEGQELHELGSRPPTPSSDELPPHGTDIDGGFVNSHHAVDAWYQPSFIDLEAALGAVEAGRQPFRDYGPKWVVSREGGGAVFRVPLTCFWWDLEMPHRVSPLYVGVRRTWLSLRVEASGYVQEPAIHSDSYAGAVEDVDPFIEQIEPYAYRAYVDLTEEFFVPEDDWGEED